MLPAKLAYLADDDGAVTVSGHNWLFALGVARDFSVQHIHTRDHPSRGGRRNRVSRRRTQVPTPRSLTPNQPAAAQSSGTFNETRRLPTDRRRKPPKPEQALVCNLKNRIERGEPSWV